MQCNQFTLTFGTKRREVQLSAAMKAETMLIWDSATVSSQSLVLC